MTANEAKLNLEWVHTDRATVYSNIDKIFKENFEQKYKAIEKLELMRKYCDDIVHSSCDYNIYCDLVDFIDSAINGLELNDK